MPPFCCLAAPQPPQPPPRPSSPHSSVPLDPWERRDLEDYGMDPDGRDESPAGEEMDPALSALLKGLPDISAEDLEDLLKDLPLPQPGATGGISVQEAVQVKKLYNILYHMLYNVLYSIIYDMLYHALYNVCYILCYITHYLRAARAFTRVG